MMDWEQEMVNLRKAENRAALYFAAFIVIAVAAAVWRYCIG